MHCQVFVAGVKKVEEFAAWQLAEAFTSEVFALLKGSQEAMRDRRGYFQEEQCRRACWFGERCFTATLRLKHSEEHYAEQLERERRAAQHRKKLTRIRFLGPAVPVVPTDAHSGDPACAARVSA